MTTPSTAGHNGISVTGVWNTFAASSPVTVALNAVNIIIRVQGGSRFTLDRIYVGGRRPPLPPPPPGFALNAPALDCGSSNGNIPLSVVNSNGNPVEYRAIGLRDRGPGKVLSIPAHQGNGTSFTFQSRQIGTEVIKSLTRGCSGYRVGVAVSEPVEDTGRDTGLVISPNPSLGRVSVGFRLGAGDRGSVVVQSLTGAVLQSRWWLARARPKPRCWIWSANRRVCI